MNDPNFKNKYVLSLVVCVLGIVYVMWKFDLFN